MEIAVATSTIGWSELKEVASCIGDAYIHERDMGNITFCGSNEESLEAKQEGAAREVGRLSWTGGQRRRVPGDQQC